MEKNKGLIAVSQEDADEFGCVKCGYMSRYMSIEWYPESGVARCANCDQLYVVLAEGIDELPPKANINHMELQRHPRQGILANLTIRRTKCAPV